MRKAIVGIFALTFLSGCSWDAGGNWNPLNWFGGDDEPELVEYEEIPLEVEGMDAEI